MTVPRPQLCAQSGGAQSCGAPAGSPGDLEQDMKMLAGRLWHRPGAASAERTVHATGRMLAGLGHLRAGLAAEAVR